MWERAAHAEEEAAATETAGHARDIRALISWPRNIAGQEMQATEA